MEIVIIGSGNVAFHLNNAFYEANIKVSQLFGRNEDALKLMSETTKIPYSTNTLQNADLYIICVKDDVIAEVSQIIKNENALVVHTSGSMPKDALEGNYKKGCFYPLQTFSKNKILDYTEIPFFIEAENPQDLDILKNLALRISPRVQEADYEKRKYIHLTAVFACNFVNHLYARAKEIADSQNIPFNYFIPLVEETMDKIYYLDPKKAQTGPAVRNDARVLELHKQLITDETQLEIYNLMNQSIKKMYEL
ncbi:Rossmann-like and DUF2520 domain-containing protein [Riemerella anatipestifer]|uniref:DUF2520 domain-containing protein n=1 Tax=Riemerella anatipestifer RA-CH-1 TaxID=1228997 RepID=J9QTA2_RIEAN|nr:DUF2520 domain-containing protein [Riemerella anatipestifer]AFR35566.1 hypothetical protein B739_0966 [Riemerella anatipestifer RA-CH-1]MCO7331867.1 DUF2520 domain-containing protein [Riemerella anatipestifer]MCO7350754.1 DUF2520 domain-containing protein [Riemerella anatipestifer]MCU7583523.1 DUF2520 domain-containing protein [Riemerella anatipestifer]MCW0486433.1 DUF2520 domain-containing protein [Riemerella anatipestifer]